MTIQDDYIYLLADSRTRDVFPLLTINIRQPAEPRLVSSVDLGDQLGSLVAKGNFLYATSWGALRVYDISHRANPRQVALQAWLSSNSAQRLLIGNGVLYAFMDQGLEVLTLHAPER